MTPVPDVSVIIVNYNTLHVLQPCLDSIEAQTHDVDYEVIVVDNGSTDGSAETLATDHRITFLPTGENLGFGKGNNYGLKHARGRYIFFLNSDTLLRNNAIKMLYDFACQYDGRLGALGCVLEDRQGSPIHSYGPFPKMSDDINHLLITPLKKALHCYHPHPTVLPDTWMKVDYVTGADLFVGRDVLDRCLVSIAEKSTYPNYEVVVVENNSEQEATFAYYEKAQRRWPNVRVVSETDYPLLLSFIQEVKVMQKKSV